ncbi:hypothetical protein CFY87_09950 [Actinobacillus seminis]|uniref:Uncharacterized protein n=1 Tax=Actinobacillus seminis TaxID=722 RepID=A0ABX4FK90_9PAST|nr:hypothetical protein [Actinobacillus seminis]OZN24245.1 hypothetical protein CFY87_09950 [Actinobacillus seminis]
MVYKPSNTKQPHYFLLIVKIVGFVIGLQKSWFYQLFLFIFIGVQVNKTAFHKNEAGKFIAFNLAKGNGFWEREKRITFYTKII